ncbi:MAG: Twin-arginine translocation pathway signal [Desulfuromonas sp.]|nr:MAG: Twin-arginine translocation pathway signal [Desulfuromonas sp.]
MDRRSFCKNTLLALTGAALPLPAWARTSPLFDTHRELSFYNTHTGEYAERVIYWSRGVYVSDGLTEIDYLLRDHRSNQIVEIDHNLLDTLYLLSRKLECQEPLHIISGYRSPTTNAELRRNSDGVAKRSLHMQGRAIDIRLPSCDLTHLHQTALNLKRGGVGYYPDSQFVHLDSGRFRTWQG